MNRTSTSWLPKLTLLVPALLVSSCVCSPGDTPPPPVKPARVPTLPNAARQEPTPLECSPTCSAAAAKELNSWRDTLTVPESPASSANAATKR